MFQGWHWHMSGMESWIKAKEYLDKAEDYVKDSKYLGLNQEIYSTSQEYYAKKNDAQNFTLATEKKRFFVGTNFFS